MAFTIGSVKIRVGADTKALQADLKKAGRVLKKEAEELKKIGTSLTQSLTIPLGIAGGAAIKMASDMEESINKVKVAFGNSSQSVIDFSKTTLEAFGISQGAALDMSATFGDMATSMGLTDIQAAQMATSLTGLAGDLASFKNINLEEAMTALNGVFTGETESLKRLGVVMLDSTLAAFALEQGIKKNYKEFTQAEKVMLRYQFVMNSTKNAQGDFSRTSNGAANQTRVLLESLKELGAEFGQVLLPTYTKVVTKLNEIVKGFRALNEEQKKNVVEITTTATVIGPLVVAFAKLKELLAGVLSRMGGLSTSFSKIAPLALALYGIIRNFDLVAKTFKDIGDSINITLPDWINLKLVAEGFDGAIRLAVGTIGALIKTLISGAKLAITAFTNLGKVILAAINPFDDIDVKSTAERAFSEIKDSFSGFVGDLKGIGNTFINDVFGDNRRPASINRGSALRRNAPIVGGEESLVIDPTPSSTREARPVLSPLAAISSIKSSGVLSELQQQLQATNTQAVGTVEYMNQLGDSMQYAKIQADEFISINFANEIESFASLLGNVFSGDLGAGGFFNGILSIVSGFMKQLGSQLVAMSTAMVKFRAAILANPISGIAAGVGLIAAGTALQGLLKKAPSLAIGTDYVKQDGFAFLHKGEKVVPADVVAGGYSRGGGVFAVYGRLSGQDIILSGSNAQRAIDRYR